MGTFWKVVGLGLIPGLALGGGTYYAVDKYVVEPKKVEQEQEATQTSESQINSLQEELEKVLTENESIKAQIQTLTASNTEKDAQLTQLQSQLTELQEQGTADATTISNLTEQISTLQTEKTQNQQTIESLQSTVAQNQQTIESLQSQLESLQPTVTYGVYKLKSREIVAEYYFELTSSQITVWMEPSNKTTHQYNLLIDPNGEIFIHIVPNDPYALDTIIKLSDYELDPHKGTIPYDHILLSDEDVSAFYGNYTSTTQPYSSINISANQVHIGDNTYSDFGFYNLENNVNIRPKLLVFNNSTGELEKTIDLLAYDFTNTEGLTTYGLTEQPLDYQIAENGLAGIYTDNNSSNENFKVIRIDSSFITFGSTAEDLKLEIDLGYNYSILYKDTQNKLHIYLVSGDANEILTHIDLTNYSFEPKTYD